MVAAHGDARRMDLGEAGVREERAPLVRPPSGGHVGVHGVGRQVVDRAVSARAEQHRLPFVTLELAGNQVSGDDAPRLAVDEHQIEHFAAGEQRDGARIDLPEHRLIRAKQQLLARLAARVEGSRDLRAAERPVVEQAAVFAGERARRSRRTDR